MNHLQIDAGQIAAAKLTDFAAGTLVTVPTETSTVAGPCWGVRFDSVIEDGVARSILWLNGMPWHGPDPSFHGMPLDSSSSYGDMRGIGCGQACIEIDLGSGAGRQGREMCWDQAAGFIVAGLHGSFLIGAKSAREMWGAHYAIDLATWTEVPDAYRGTTVEWFSRWNVVVGTKRGAVLLPFDARAKNVARGP